MVPSKSKQSKIRGELFSHASITMSMVCHQTPLAILFPRIDRERSACWMTIISQSGPKPFQQNMHGRRNKDCLFPLVFRQDRE